MAALPWLTLHVQVLLQCGGEAGLLLQASRNQTEERYSTYRNVYRCVQRIHLHILPLNVGSASSICVLCWELPGRSWKDGKVQQVFAADGVVSFQVGYGWVRFQVQ